MKKSIISLSIAFLALDVSAREVNRHFESYDRTCPQYLDLVETYVGGHLERLKITRDDPKDIYIPEVTYCSNVEGQAVNTNDDNSGSTLTCMSREDSGGPYEVRIVYEILSKDPSDYGFKREYRIYKTDEGVQAYWGRDRSYDGAPIYCNYNLVQ